uniref:hypothetical protein n=1 Tax=Marinobacterium profundum TaxID=1714300 RepID=UPI000AF179C4|nr:hypothetical protein [Marinobacterium profundum]
MLDSILANLNSLLKEYPLAGIFVALIITAVYESLKWVFKWALYRLNTLTGKWVLVIFDSNTQNVSKVDLYRFRQIGNTIKGDIRRLYAGPAASEVGRKYTMTGFSDASKMFFSFWPKRNDTASWGTCNLVKVDDRYFVGYYNRPVKEDGTLQNENTLEVRLCRSYSMIEDLTKGLPSKDIDDAKRWIR